MKTNITAITTVFGMLDDIKTNNEEWKKRILKEYKESSKLPRKQKKALRKSLNLDWNIINFNPFDF